MEFHQKEIIRELNERVDVLERENKRLRLSLSLAVRDTPNSNTNTKGAQFVDDRYLETMPELLAQSAGIANDVARVYRKVEILGRGTGGIVYRAQRRSDNQPACLKLLKRPDGGGGAPFGTVRELIHLTVCDHPNIIPLLDVVAGHSGQIYLVEELATTDVQQVIRKHYTALSHASMRTMLLDCFQALCYLHSNGMAHRDIKPANLLYCTGGVTKLCDFGSSTRNIRDPPQPQTPHVTTLWYAAPEMVTAEDYDIYDGQIDTWAMGVIVLQLLFNRPQSPFNARDPGELVHLWMSMLGPPATTHHGLACDSSVVYHADPILDSLGSTAAALIRGLLHYDPVDRLTAAQALQDPWLTHKPCARELMPIFKAATAPRK